MVNCNVNIKNINLRFFIPLSSNQNDSMDTDCEYFKPKI